MFGRKKKSTNPFEEEPSAPPPPSQYQNQEKSSAYTQRYPSSASQTHSPPPSYRSNSQSDLSNREQLFGDAPSRSRFQARNQYNSSESVPTSDRYGGGRSRYNGSSQYGAGYDDQGQQDAYGSSKWGEDEADQEVSGLKQQIRNVKQDTLASSRNAVQKIREAEEASGNTMNMLGEQSSQIASVDRNLDLAKAHSDRASAKASELKQLNRSIFIPVIKNPFNRASRERKELEAVRQDHSEHMQERNAIRQYEYESKERMERSQRASGRQSANAGFRGRSQSDRQRYQFEADEEDDEVENEIDSNLDFLSDAVGRLKNNALTMGEEVEAQNKVLDKVGRKVDPLSDRLTMTTHRLNNTR
ncbi:hypothetical protein BC943DRAFT_335852 [Umbelopsis sp. AD052]|nr:hypothetical protein BC943DRAFT_335852 [Umbelopsis sp. AD052]